MLTWWSVGVVAGLALAVWASRRALDSAVDLGQRAGLSPFVIGMTIMAIGTDLPEMANSVVASATGNGDLNVADSVGSVVTQGTLVLGILCWVAPIAADRRFVVTAGALTTLSLLIGAVLFSDGRFDRTDGALLIAAWLTGTLVIQRPMPAATEVVGTTSVSRRLLISVVGNLCVVGIGATIAIESFARAAEDLGVDGYLLGFFLLAAGTSLPELVVDIRALREGHHGLALGDVLGSCFVDATLSPGIGPVLFPTALSAGVERGSLVAAATVAVATIILASRAEHRWLSGLGLIVLYGSLYAVLL